ncbi:MAG: hypothetical protein ACPGWR_00160 [Ardenticatenaceae bacterium]
MRVTRDTGIIVVCGELVNSTFYLDQDNYMRATYYIRTSDATWTDPTGEPGAKNINWIVSAWDFAANCANPSYRFPEKHIAIEGIPLTKTTRAATNEPEFWRTKTNRPKKTIKLTALFTEFVDDFDAERLANHIKWYRRGTKYSPWWRAEDSIPDNAPHLLPSTVHLSGEQDWGGGYQDNMRGDAEFFYEDERWSRDP